MQKVKRRYPVGAEIIPRKGAHFRVWAPDHKKVELVLENGDKPRHFPMKREQGGYFSLLVPEAKENTQYRYKIKKELLADPASRFQPGGCDGSSLVIDPKFPWTDQKWKGLDLKGQIIYEIHIGTFTQEGTFAAAAKQLRQLATLGITIVEVMPINTFPGHFGWGYDGVNLFAPMHIYGTPYDVKNFINEAHKLGIAVILDVVYNHLGPEGNQMPKFAKSYMSNKVTDWGDTINFDSPNVREFFLSNARYWLDEYHFDGLRFDSTSFIHSSTPVHVLAEFSQHCKKYFQRKIILIAENEPQDVKFLRSYKEGGYNFDAIVNDDFHHTAHVRATGKREAYYTDYLGSPQEFISSFKYGFLYQGQFYDWQKQNRGTPELNLPPQSLIVYLENHDQAANSGYGKRLHLLSDPGSYKILTCLLLLGPNTPMLFQGQEFCSNSPFYYFADHSAALSKKVYEGRIQFLAQFQSLATEETRALVPDPADPSTFTACKLDLKERERNKQIYLLHKDLISLRRNDAVFKIAADIKIDGSVLGTDSFLIRYFGGEHGDRLLIVNFGPDHYFNPAPDPLLVPPRNCDWKLLWSSESAKYGGDGTPPFCQPYWKILGHSAIVLKSVEQKKKKK